MGIFGFVVIAILSLAQAGGARTWTDSMGRTLEGELVRASGDDVVLRINGVEKTIPLLLLCEADREFVAKQKGAQPANPNPEAAPQPARGKPINVADAQKSRTWTDRDGNRMTAEWTDVAGAQLVFRINRKQQRFPYLSFCDDDRKLVRAYLEWKGIGSLAPPEADELNLGMTMGFRTREGRQVSGHLRKIEPGGNVVFQENNGRASIPFHSLNEDQQSQIYEVAEKAKLADIIPPHPDARTWQDWRGEKLSARFMKFGPYGQSLTLRTNRGEIYKSYFSFAAGDRAYIRDLVQKAGGNLDQFPEFVEPTTPIRSWTSGSTGRSKEGRFIGTNGKFAIVRTDSSNAERISLNDLLAADQQYVLKTLTDRGEGHLFPLLNSEALAWEYGPLGVGLTFKGRIVAVEKGVARFQAESLAGTLEDLEVAFSCMSPVSQKQAREEMKKRGIEKLDENLVLSLVIEPRRWNIKGDPRVIAGPIAWVDGINVGINFNGGVIGKSYSTLSPEDQEYVRAELKVRPLLPPPPPPTPVVVNPAPQPPRNSSQNNPTKVRVQVESSGPWTPIIPIEAPRDGGAVRIPLFMTWEGLIMIIGFFVVTGGLRAWWYSRQQ